MTLLSDFYIHSGEIPPPDDIIPGFSWPRRPDASGEFPEIRSSFAGPSPLGEFPIGVALETPRPRPEVTARIVTSVHARPAAPVDGPRPWWYRGQHRLTRSAALLAAATWTGGVR